MYLSIGNKKSVVYFGEYVLRITKYDYIKKTFVLIK